MSVTCWSVLVPLLFHEVPSTERSLRTGDAFIPAGKGVGNGSKGSADPPLPSGCSLIDCSRRTLVALGTTTGCSCIDCSRRNLEILGALGTVGMSRPSSPLPAEVRSADPARDAREPEAMRTRSCE